MTDERPSLDRLYQMLSVTAFGCNQRLQGIIEKKLDDLGHSGHSAFWEYFLEQPLPVRGTLDPHKALFFAPFARRVAENSPTIPDITEKDGKVELTHRFASSEDDHPPLIFECDRSSLISVFYQNLAAHWKSDPDPKRVDYIDTNADIPFTAREANRAIKKLGYLHVDGGWLPFLPAVDHRLQRWDKRVHQAKKSLTRSLRKLQRGASQESVYNAVVAASKIYEYGYVQSQFSLLDHEHRIFATAFPICSTNILYGEFWLMMPPFAENVSDDLTKNRRRYLDLLQELAEEIQKTYAPALALLHERFAEDSLQEVETPGETFEVEVAKPLSRLVRRIFKEEWKEPKLSRRTYRVPFVGEHSDRGTTFADRIERHLYRLWERRTDGSRQPENSYLFSKYALCSPKMIALVVRVMEHGQRLRQGSGSQSTALVVGGAGSGKETLCSLIALFSSSYFSGKQFIVNLAALKPQQLATPLLTGAILTVVDPQSGLKPEAVGTTKVLQGIFSRVRQRTEEIVLKAAEEVGETLNKRFAEKTLEGRYPMLILDELNSLDIESQGSLLRFLDNSEIVPIGEPDPRALCTHPGEVEKLFSHCLVIGAMNEDPDELSREQAIKFIRDQEYLGGMIGDMLYEHFVRMRRLRPDVKYRLIRGGKFVIPALHERREDIPLLFDLYVNQEIGGLSDDEKKLLFSADSKVVVDFEAFRALMDSSLLWPGNIRELQAVVKSAFQFAMTDAVKPCEALRISRKHVRKALKADDATPAKASR